MTFLKTGNEQLIHEIASPLIAQFNEEIPIYLDGTATIIGKGYGITASHVLEEFAKRSGVQSFNDGLNFINCILRFYISVNKGKDIIPLRVLRAWKRPPSDITFFAFGAEPEINNSHRWKLPKITLLPPKVGDNIFAFGFAESETLPNTERIPTANVKPRTTTGTVKEVYHLKRDNSRMPFPGFLTNLRFDGGMSGGPVFNSSNGSLCGIISSSIPANTSEEEHSSFVSTLWPMVNIQVDITKSDYFGGPNISVMDLFNRKEIIASDIQYLVPMTDINGNHGFVPNYDKNNWKSK